MGNMTDRTADDGTLDQTLLAELWQASPDGSGRFVVMLIDEFLAEGAAQVRVLTDASAAFEPARLRAAAHSLKGSSSTFGARNLAAVCHQIEADLRQHPDREITPDLRTALDREFVQVCAALSRERTRASGLPATPEAPVPPDRGKVAS